MIVSSSVLSASDIKLAVRGWLRLQRARVAHRRHPELGEVGAYCFYATRLRFRELAFDIGANHGEHTAQMLGRGARVVAVEPHAKVAADLSTRFPAATVLQMAVSDEPGRAVFHMCRENDKWSSLDASWLRRLPGTWEGSEEVIVTTLDELIGRYGEPAVVKIDAEGFDYRVLRGLSRPIAHILFEAHAAHVDAAAEAFTQLDELGCYDYRASPYSWWQFGGNQNPQAILEDMQAEPDWVGIVYARRVR
jgi:FkbM family methyltransferase